MTEHLIGGVPVTAPLWRNATPEQLEQIIEHLSSASYHYADDSGGEWGAAAKRLREAAKAVNDLGLGHRAIECLVKHKPQLVTTDRLYDAVLADARGQ